MSGLSSGRLLHSLCLAPGEVTQIAMVDWRRESRASSSGSVSESERATSSARRTRDTREVAEAVANELQRGGSSASSVSHHAQGGASIGFASGGGSTSSSVASSVNWSTGERRAAAIASQRVRQSTDQHTSNARSRQATLVEEISESETEQFTTRVVANYNHMHSLNMQYY